MSDVYQALENVAKAREDHDKAVAARDAAIAEARRSEASLRQIAEAAGISHEKARKILREQGVATA